MRHPLKEITKKRLILALITLVFISSNAQKTEEGFPLEPQTELKTAYSFIW